MLASPIGDDQLGLDLVDRSGRPLPAGLRCLLRRRARGEGGAEAMEFALVLPLFVFVVLVSMQLALIGMVRYEVKYITRQTARWLAVNPDTTDSQLLAAVQGQVLPGMASGGIVSLAASPACPSLTGGHCFGRASGVVITLGMTYDASTVYFLPTHFFGFSMGSKQVDSQVSILIE